jgi:hypothetical protein
VLLARYVPCGPHGAASANRSSVKRRPAKCFHPSRSRSQPFYKSNAKSFNKIPEPGGPQSKPVWYHRSEKTSIETYMKLALRCSTLRRALTADRLVPDRTLENWLCSSVSPPRSSRFHPGGGKRSIQADIKLALLCVFLNRITLYSFLIVQPTKVIASLDEGPSEQG